MTLDDYTSSIVHVGPITAEMAAWCEQNCHSDVHFHSGDAYFDNEDDALLFKLTWVNG